ncbi:stress response protein NST1-like [Coccinella septempunctata]|uniref:stress response protein NST1-like n=1 Tax=Coccinella septempunctata TaxID=41139 RepID=UPI001D077CF2|nr:stress response protein NST1-like [Coccinella septempunctata]
MGSNRICSFRGCNNSSRNKNCCFFEFPQDFNLCIQWVEIIGCKELLEDFAFQGPEPFRGRFICSDHFTEEDFVDNCNTTSGLKKDAVPFYFISNRKSEDSMTKISVKSEQSDGDFWDEHGITNSSVFPDDILSSVKVEDESSHFSPSGDSFQSAYFNLKRKSKERVRRRANETPEQLAERRLQCAQRAYLRRKMETLQEKETRRKANAERQAKKRMSETPEQREIRRVKDVLRSRRRRQTETEEETRLRRMQDAARAQARRQNESEEEKIMRRMRDLERVTKRRRNETDEERMERLRKNREYSAKRRYEQRLEQELTQPRNPMDDTFLTLRNLEQDMPGVNGGFFQSLAAFTDLHSDNHLNDATFNKVNTEHNSNTRIIPGVANLNACNLSSLAFSHFLSSLSQDSNSFEGTSEESMRSLSNDSSYDVPVVRPNGEEHPLSEKTCEISAHT